MNVKSAVIPVEMIEKAIFFIRNQRVMLDTDLAALYGVQTKVLNQAVKRNERRFPSDFVFFLTKEEKDELVTNCDRLKRMRHSSALPRAFTEQGVAMLQTCQLHFFLAQRLIFAAYFRQLACLIRPNPVT